MARKKSEMLNDPLGEPKETYRERAKRLLSVDPPTANFPKKATATQTTKEGLDAPKKMEDRWAKRKKW